MQLFDLWELINHIVVEILTSPDTFLAVERVEHEGDILLMRHTQDSCLAVVGADFVALDLVNDALEKRVGLPLPIPYRLI